MGLVISQEVLDAFEPLRGTLSAAPLGTGHIHDTFLLETAKGKYVLQAFNTDVFKQADEVAANIAKVSGHLKGAMAKQYPLDAERRYMNVISCKVGPLYKDSQGKTWRLFDYLSGTYTIDSVETAEQAWQAARAYGEFIRLLAPLALDDFQETIPDFHYLPFRLKQFEDALASSKATRKEMAGELIERLPEAAMQILSALPLTDLPKRIVHNDTKINNVLLDLKTEEGLCVIDLDTVMPGYLLYDYGDMVRTFVSPTAEDETDLSRIVVRQDIMKALREGFLTGLGDIITEKEASSLPLGGKLMACIMSLRFLTDFLNGDVYYKTHYPMQNLDRAKNQFCLLELL